VSLTFDTVSDAERVFAALSAGGTTQMPFQKTFWSPGFGMTVDRFGTPWMVNTNQPA
jgi:PhnB protein